MSRKHCQCEKKVNGEEIKKFCVMVHRCGGDHEDARRISMSLKRR